MNTLAIVVMAHPSRRERAERMAEWAGARCIIWDHLTKGEWDTGVRAWRAGYELGTSHVLVLQDDAEPVRDLEEHVLAAIEHAPDSPISLYLGRSKPTRWAATMATAVEQADAHDASWIQATHLLHGVAIVLPAKWIPQMLEWAELSRLPYDQRIGAYLRQVQGKHTLYTWPSLVDHDDTIPSLVEHEDDNRKSTTGRIAYRAGIPEQLGPRAIIAPTPRGAEA